MEEEKRVRIETEEEQKGKEDGGWEEEGSRREEEKSYVYILAVEFGKAYNDWKFNIYLHGAAISYVNYMQIYLQFIIQFLFTALLYSSHMYGCVEELYRKAV